jgi:2-dehydro-3-deoxyphosphooctonate aldolase (KDO 8-P synthase)
MPHPRSVLLGSDVELGGEMPVLIAGPCAVESYDLVYETAKYLKDLTIRLGVPFILKASIDKANRTSIASFRSIGVLDALGVLKAVRRELNVPTLTDVHETEQVAMVASAVDVLQIPAFLCRQTDLIQAAARTGRPVNLKRGQFMAPGDMQFGVDKVRSAGNDQVFITERGSTFGYHNLVVDMRALPIMRKFSPVVFDVTHSVQTPGSMGGVSGGEREFGPYLARAAAAVGVDGFFIETHPEPLKALSDGPNLIPLEEMADLVESLLAVWQSARSWLR